MNVGLLLGFAGSPHIWSPPVLQGIVFIDNRDRLLPYIRPVFEALIASGLDALRAYRPSQPIGFC